jgi:transposase InsO family protein
MIHLAAQSLLTPDALPLSAICETLGLSRATYYRQQAKAEVGDPDVELRDQIQRLALQWPQYGYRRLTAELHRQGVNANHKRVLRLMREDNLLCLRKRRFFSTTDSRHSLLVYPNLLPELTITAINQLWVADITYIRLLREFIYLAVILDAYSRRCIGWALAPYLETALALEALQMALANREVTGELVHHSDRGVQYASTAYTDLLKEQGIRISMSRRGNPYDNAQAERFMRTLKYEEAYLFEYETMADARSRIQHFLEEVYNQPRLHSALGYVPPTEFEQQLGHSTDA